MSEFTSCAYFTQEPKRKSELKISQNLKSNSEFLRKFQFNPETRLIQITIARNTQQAIQAKSSRYDTFPYHEELTNNSSSKQLVGDGQIDTESGLQTIGWFSI